MYILWQAGQQFVTGLETFRRIAARYLVEAQAAIYLRELTDPMVILRLVPGQLRTWDFRDEPGLAGSA